MTHNEVRIINDSDITALHISPKMCVAWAEESLRMKYSAILPPKISLHPQGNDFFNTMPCILPSEYNTFGMKEVRRIEQATPALSIEIFLYDNRNGHMKAIMGGDWLTAMRTGAVTAIAIRLLQKKSVDTYSFIGLGNIGRACALCLIEDNLDRKIKFRLMRYKDQAESFIERMSCYPNVEFEIIDDINTFVAEADVIVSSITVATDLICPDNNLYRPGVLVVPVHTRGFQNCDLFFDKVFGDDKGHIEGFKYFNQYKHFDELSNVLLGNSVGRENDNERILSYNIGLALHDIVYASKILPLFTDKNSSSFLLNKENRKIWV
jgi:ornithine cyclodeaminase